MKYLKPKSKLTSVCPYKKLLVDQDNTSQLQMRTRIETLIKLPFVKSPTAQKVQTISKNIIAFTKPIPNTTKSSKNIERLQKIKWTTHRNHSVIDLPPDSDKIIKFLKRKPTILSIRLTESQPSIKEPKKYELLDVQDDRFFTQTVFWATKPLLNEKFNATEYSSMFLLKDLMYICGGQSANHLLDIKSFNNKTNQLFTIKTNFAITGMLGFSMIGYKNTLYLYGGCFINASGLRKFNKNLCCVNIKSNTVEIIKGYGAVPKGRKNHSACRLENFMLLFGGVFKNGCFTNELSTLNMRTLHWDLIDAPKQPSARSQSSLTPVFAHQGSNLSNSDRIVNYFQKSSMKNSGVYLFGGIDSKGICYNDMHCLTIHNDRLCWSKVEAAGGEIPPARYAHATTSIGHRLYLFGGRCGNEANTKTLLDLYVFNLFNQRWEEVCIKGYKPEFRWGHSVGNIGSQVLLYGGLTYKGFASAELYCLETNQEAAVRFEETHDQNRTEIPFWLNRVN